jgi:hypothetical protein
MANFIALSKGYQARIDELAAQLTRVEIHVRREERRAARARLNMLYGDMEAVLNELSFPMDFMIAGANLGLLSGKGSMLRGRLPAIALGAVAGWMAGQASVMQQRKFAEAILERALDLEVILGDNQVNTYR